MTPGFARRHFNLNEEEQSECSNVRVGPSRYTFLQV